MAKTRKTKKEKLRSSQKVSHTTAQPSADVSPSSEGSVFTFSTTATAVSSPGLKNATPTTILHLKQDLLRTGMVIFAIIIAELILFYTLAVR